MSKKVCQLSLFLITALCLEGTMKPVGARPSCHDMRENCEAGKCEDALTEVRGTLIKETLSWHCTSKRCDEMAQVARNYNECMNIP